MPTNWRNLHQINLFLAFLKCRSHISDFLDAFRNNSAEENICQKTGQHCFLKMTYYINLLYWLLQAFRRPERTRTAQMPAFQNNHWSMDPSRKIGIYRSKRVKKQQFPTTFVIGNRWNRRAERCLVYKDALFIRWNGCRPHPGRR